MIQWLHLKGSQENFDIAINLTKVFSLHLNKDEVTLTINFDNHTTKVKLRKPICFEEMIIELITNGSSMLFIESIDTEFF